VSERTVLAPEEAWRQIRAVEAPLGEGGRGWYPYMVRSGISDAVARLATPVETLSQWLASERDPLWREVILFLLAAQDDDRVDGILVDALGDPALRPRALYLIGVIGTRGWPKRERDTPSLLRAVLPWTTDATPYVDPVYGTTLETGDLAKAAYMRLAGPERFPALRRVAEEGEPLAVNFVGMEIAAFSPGQRVALQADIDAVAGG
jgi:hypothetical protein